MAVSWVSPLSILICRRLHCRSPVRCSASVTFAIPLLVLLRPLLQAWSLSRGIDQWHKLFSLESLFHYASRPDNDTKMSGIELGGSQGQPDLIYKDQLIARLKFDEGKCRKVGLVPLISTIDFLKLIRWRKRIIIVLNHIVLFRL